MNYKLGPHPSLIEVSSPWEFNQDGDAVVFEQAMCQFMIEANGIGLAANQIGISKQVFTMGSNNIAGFPAPFALFNPKILDTSTSIVMHDEGCLSYPNLFLKIKRPSWIIAEYQDSKGNIIEARFDGYLAKCFQHELDHLGGVCFVDRVSPLKLQLAMKKLRKLK
jgi:peptide deformylase